MKIEQVIEKLHAMKKFKNAEVKLNLTDSEDGRDPDPLDSEADEMRYWCFQ